MLVGLIKSKWKSFCYEMFLLQSHNNLEMYGMLGTVPTVQNYDRKTLGFKMRFVKRKFIYKMLHANYIRREKNVKLDNN